MTSMTTGFGYRDGAPDDALIAHLQARSGGVSMSTVAFGAIAPEGRVELAGGPLRRRQGSH